MEFFRNILRRIEGDGAVCILCTRRCNDLKINIDGVGVCCECYDEIIKTRANDYYDVVGLERLFAPFAYVTDLRNAILNMKFSDFRSYAPVLARLAADALPPYYLYSEYDMIVPVPLHPKRLAARGFNQSELIAVELSRIIDVPVMNDVLFRIRRTMHQMTLPRMLRNINVHGAFAADRNSVEGKRILLVDDIYTVGATVRACSAELYDKGAVSVSAIVVAENFTKRKYKEPGIMIPVIEK